MPEKYSKSCCCLNCPEWRPYVSARYGWKYSEKKTLTVEWILMLIQKQQAVISAGIRRGVGVAPRCNLFQPLSLTDLKVGLQKMGEGAGGRWEGGGWSRGSRHPSATSKLTDHSPKYGRFTKLRPELWPRPPVLVFPTRVAVWGKSSALNPPAGICSFGQLWLLSGYYSAQQRMAEHGDSSWQSHRRPMPSLPLHISATQKQPRLFIYNLLWKSPHTSLW